jgi:hypothetical protein
MHHYLLRILFWAFILGFALGSTPLSRAQEPASPWCSPEQLDLNLGPQGDSPNSIAHCVTIEFHNRLGFPCKLHAGLSGDGPFYNDSAPAAAAFRENSQRIPPGGLVHLFFAWTSAPVATDGIVIDHCRMNDAMTITPFSDPWLEIRHLWARTCDSWWSAFRLGPYARSESISKEWLERVHLQESDFAPGDPPGSPDPDPPARGGVKLWTLSNVQYLQGGFGTGYYNGFHLILELSSGGFANCPLHSVRKRESDGKTTIYLSSREDHPKPLSKTLETKAMALWTSDFGLSPERTGRVEYTVVSNILRDGKLASAEAHLEVSVRDPNRPALPVIDTASSACRTSQLSLTSPIVQLGAHWDHPTTYPQAAEDWYDGKIFELTNTSGQSCVLGGLPQLKFLPWRTSGGLDPSRCANCANPLFQPREIRWIELQPNDSAHFIVVRSASHLAYSYWCNVTGGMELSLPEDTQAKQLPFEASFCGPIHISAWRSGKYDGDPLNTQYGRSETERDRKWLASAPPAASKVVCVDNSKPKSQLPPPGPQCAEEESSRHGKPAMAPARAGIAFGVSSSPGSPTNVNIWMDNQTDKSQYYSMCCRSSFLAAIEIYDSAGHRLLSKGEQSFRKMCSEGQELAWACSCSILVTVPPHSMQVVDSGDLEDGYVLPPGRYFFASCALDRSTCEAIKKIQAGAGKREPANAVLLVIPDK